MKRIISIFISIFILFGMTNSFAEEEVKEILWQNIPWGSNQKEVSSYLKNMDDVDVGAQIMEIGTFNNLLITNSAEKVLQYPIDIGLEQGSDALFFGYKSLFFDYKVVQIIFIFNNTEKGKNELIGVDITLQNADKADLVQKLTSTYGDAEESPDGSFVWKGDMETAVCIGKNDELVYSKVFDVNNP